MAMTQHHINASSYKGPLAGIRIVEFAGIGPGPFAAMLLADMGADIVRIDRIGGSDPWSGKVVRRNRSTLELDLRNPVDIETALNLIKHADALIEGYRPGVMERLGLGPDTCLALNPRLVFGRMTGWGQDGPLAKTAGHDIGYIAITGALAAIGPRDRPVPPLNLVGDLGGGSLYLVMGVLAAIIHARASGEGQVVDCAICDGTVSLMSMFSDLVAQTKWQLERETNVLDGVAPYYGVYECSDGKHIAVGALEPQFYAQLCQSLGRAVDDEGFRTDPRNWPSLRAAFATIFKTQTQPHWCAVFEGSDACFAPVLTLDEAPLHPHLAARQTFVEANGLVQPAPAPRFSKTPGDIRAAESTHTDAQSVLRRWQTSAAPKP